MPCCHGLSLLSHLHVLYACAVLDEISVKTSMYTSYIHMDAHPYGNACGPEITITYKTYTNW